MLIDARIVLSEVVSNSYKHAGNPPGASIEVTVTDSQNRLRLEIVDRSIFDPTPETTEELRSAKWGLHIVNQLADEWGRITEGGIWAEFDTGEERSNAEAVARTRKGPVRKVRADGLHVKDQPTTNRQASAGT